MTDDFPGKDHTQDFALVPAGTDLAKPSKPAPTLVQIGDRWLTSDGRWHPQLAADYVLAHGGLTRWIPVGELARVFFGSGSPSNKARIRFRMHTVLRMLLAKGFLLVVEYGPRAAAQACKIYDPKSQTERQYIKARLERMAKLKSLKVAQFDRAVALVEEADHEMATATGAN